MKERALAWAERAYLPLMGVMSIVIAVLNFHARHDFHTIEKHLVFRQRILSGFATTDVVPGYAIPPTFPMWGYGWVLLLTTNKVALIALQLGVALFSVWYFLETVDKLGLLNAWSRTFLRILIVLCTPWYAYHSIDWSQSLATSFLILSLSLFIRATDRAPTKWAALGLSAVFFGLNLNLASDLYLLPLPLACVYWLWAGPSRTTALRSICWLAGIVLTLVPWMVYTWHATGRPLVRSTNQGHVLLIGLGQDPARRFGVTYSDGDPMMYQILRDRLGDDFARRFYASCSYEADGVLRRAFLKLVMSRPLAYLDLALFKARRILTGEIGTYAGEFDEGENLGSFGISAPLRRGVRRFSQETGHLLQLGTTVFVGFPIWAAFRSRRAARAILLMPIVYQYVSGSLAVLQPQYISNLILLQLLVCADGLGVLSASLWRR